MKTNSIPASKAKTAYGLLSEVAAIIAAEPKRIAMARWLERDSDYAPDTPAKGFPACGTVGCIGGWIGVLKCEPGEDPQDVASGEILGIDVEMERQLFLDEALCSARNQQTRAHASAVIRHIRKFQKKHAAQLKAKRV